MDTHRKAAGIAASPGTACGPAYLADMPLASGNASAGPDAEAAALAAALDEAAHALRALAAGRDRTARAYLDVQQALIEDPEILDETAALVQAGAGAGAAWRMVMDTLIARFRESGDARLAARTSDIADVRDRVLAALSGRALADFPAGSVFVGNDLPPSRFLAHDWSAGGGIVLAGGSTLGHVAMLARSQNVPMVVVATGLDIRNEEPVCVDGDTGDIEIGGPVRSLWRRRQNTLRPENGRIPRPLKAFDGTATVLQVNINGPGDLASVDVATTDGIGLVRTEFLVPSPSQLLDENGQAEVYGRLMNAAGDLPVTIRLFDFGGDKPMQGVSEAERFPGASPRGIERLLQLPDILRCQLRALILAAGRGNLRILLPFVTAASQIDMVRTILAEETSILAKQGKAHASAIPVGMMVEVPAIAVALDAFTTSDFFSIGTNDLARQLAAADHDAPVASRREGTHSAVLELVARAVAHAGAMNRPIGICGDHAGDPTMIPALLRTGLRQFSVAPARQLTVRSAIAASLSDGSPNADGWHGA